MVKVNKYLFMKNSIFMLLLNPLITIKHAQRVIDEKRYAKLYIYIYIYMHFDYIKGRAD